MTDKPIKPPIKRQRGGLPLALALAVGAGAASVDGQEALGAEQYSQRHQQTPQAQFGVQKTRQPEGKWGDVCCLGTALGFVGVGVLAGIGKHNSKRMQKELVAEQEWAKGILQRDEMERRNRLSDGSRQKD